MGKSSTWYRSPVGYNKMKDIENPWFVKPGGILEKKYLKSEIEM